MVRIGCVEELTRGRPRIRATELHLHVSWEDKQEPSEAIKLMIKPLHSSRQLHVDMARSARTTDTVAIWPRHPAGAPAR